MRISNSGRVDFDKLLKIESDVVGSKSTGCITNKKNRGCCLFCMSLLIKANVRIAFSDIDPCPVVLFLLVSIRPFSEVVIFKSQLDQFFNILDG